MNDALLNSYRYFRRLIGAPAHRALAKARKAVATGKPRWPYGAPDAPSSTRQDDGMTHISDPAAFGLRLVGNVQSEVYRYSGNAAWNTVGHDGGWHTDPYGDVMKDGSGSCWGVVYQLPGRKGETRYVAGYEYGGCDGGPTLDLRTVYSDPTGQWDTDPRDTTAARDAAKAADKMAQAAAEEERDYQTAWQAGSQWADKKGDAQVIRKHALALGRERRAAKGAAGFPTICETIRAAIASARRDVGKLRREMHKLAQGDRDGLIFWPGDKRLQDAFNEAAGERVLS